MNSASTAFALLVTMTLVSCRDGRTSSPLQPTIHRLPQLEEMPLTIPNTELPWTEPPRVALTAAGLVTYPIGSGDGGFRFVTVDTAGNVLARFGAHGEGPSESTSGSVVSGDSVIVLASYAPNAILAFSGSGRLLHERRDHRVGGFPQALVGDSLDFSYGSRLVGKERILADVKGPIVRTCIYRRCERVLLAADDSILRLVHEATPRLGGMRWPPFAASTERFVIADGVSYRLWMFSNSGKLIASFGRDVPPRHLTEREIEAKRSEWQELAVRGLPIDTVMELKSLLEQPIPYFGHGSMGFDGRGRLWVYGTDGDSAFLDVFSDTTFLGRTTVVCGNIRGVFAVRGRWIAMSCEQDGNIENPYRIRLFRIRK